MWARSTTSQTPALICENTLFNGDAARMFGSLKMMNFSQVVGERDNGTTAYALESSQHQGIILVLAGGFLAETVVDETFANFSLKKGFNSGVRLSVNNSGVGTVQADVKNFVQPDPDDIKLDIVYASLEGPEAAAYVRGTSRLVNGVARIALPRHFQNVSVADGMTVQVTPRSADSEGMAVVSRSLTGFEVRELRRGRGTYEFDWRVEAVRRGFTDYKVRRSWEERLDPKADRSDALESRRRHARDVYGIEYAARRP